MTASALSAAPESACLKPLSRYIWQQRYQASSPDGTPLDHSIADTWRRVARAVASVEEHADLWAGHYYNLLSRFAFIPAGRILAGAGTRKLATLFNCFVMGPIEDDFDAIYRSLHEAASTLRQGGGIGCDFTSLRPRGSLIRGQGAGTSGPVSFMHLWDMSCRVIMSGGARRGAMMGIMACDHPDIMEFIAAKRVQGALSSFNLSVLLSDAFMAAMRSDAPWPLRFGGNAQGEVSARGMWSAFIEAAHASGDPGAIFIDRVRQMNNLYYCETIVSTNPCGEIPLPHHGACLLGSMNLPRFIRKPFSREAHLDEAALAEAVHVAVRFLDAAIDISRFPLEPQREEARAKRRIGLGITGLADALIMCGARYGGDRSLDLAGAWMGVVRDAAYRASARLAQEKGAFPAFDRTAFLDGHNVSALPPALRDDIARHGLRNGCLTAVAPAGTISLLADNVSSGIEPVFRFDCRRRIRLPQGGFGHVRSVDWAYDLFRRTQPSSQTLPPAFVEVDDLSVADHLSMQQAIQARTDSSVSKTINVPQDCAVEEIDAIFVDAHRRGLKGCTVFRPNEITGSILVDRDEPEDEQAIDLGDGECPICDAPLAQGLRFQ
ncbi:MAG TPA: adenosylcobalamin-dependent ribonucleoside-diphosphate reductase [Magnetospirillum sp.]|nr:adenosylcobalamin-dependent ribonucleoside-diphosphate reductase [Magnetospirillum sp.]